ncbi:unnamed protein product [Ranitomeya imitator]|uniref:D-aminoacyl-tRNA deacylase n=1 Tax=Ranitomeya imitator TaxID=111125 RepID=A0ABN9LDJ7_9NEOB|nr:unnamed protein product [Ranitomeya imitator]
MDLRGLRAFTKCWQSPAAPQSITAAPIAKCRRSPAAESVAKYRQNHREPQSTTAAPAWDGIYRRPPLKPGPPNDLCDHAPPVTTLRPVPIPPPGIQNFEDLTKMAICIYYIFFYLVGEEQISVIGRGICVLLGISVEDTQKDIDYIIHNERGDPPTFRTGTYRLKRGGPPPPPVFGFLSGRREPAGLFRLPGSAKPLCGVQEFGWIINREKSKLEPTRCQMFLGVLLDSENQLSTLPEEKKQKIIRKIMSDGNQGKHRVTKHGPALSYPMFTLVTSEDIAESASHTPIQRCQRDLNDQKMAQAIPTRPAISQQGPDRWFLSGSGRIPSLVVGAVVDSVKSYYRIRKILNLRIFEDDSGKHWSKSVMDKQYEVLCVSQFTLQCILKGNKPDYHMAMPSEQAEPFYNDFLQQMRKAYKPELIKGKNS